MQLGRTLIGAIIGAVIGIAVMVAVYFVLHFDKAWMALPVAILTGLGVRTMVATSGHASYLRGALTGALALGAYLLGSNVVAQIAQQNAAKAAQSAHIEQKADAGDPMDGADGEKAANVVPAEAPEAPPVDARPRPATSTMRRPAAPSGLPTLDFIVLCVSALIAYELGRGTAPKAMQVAEADGEAPPSDVPQGAHPDA